MARDTTRKLFNKLTPDQIKAAELLYSKNLKITLIELINDFDSDLENCICDLEVAMAFNKARTQMTIATVEIQNHCLNMHFLNLIELLTQCREERDEELKDDQEYFFYVDKEEAKGPQKEHYSVSICARRKSMPNAPAHKLTVCRDQGFNTIEEVEEFIQSRLKNENSPK